MTYIWLVGTVGYDLNISLFDSKAYSFNPLAYQKLKQVQSLWIFKFMSYRKWQEKFMKEQFEQVNNDVQT
jgi:hypothetical protein